MSVWTDLNDPTGYQRRKQARKEWYDKYVKGWKLEKCGACNGSGRYDHCIKGRIPRCGCCGGSGKLRVPPPTV